MNAHEIREWVIAQGPFSSLGMVAAVESNARNANGLPERDAELDGVRCPPELCIWLALAEDHPDRQRHDHAGQHLPNPWSAHGPVFIAPLATQLLGELAGYRYPEPPRGRPATEREHDMDRSTTTDQAPGRVEYGAASGQPSEAPGSPRAAIARATAQLVQEVTNFPNDQEDAHRAYNLVDPEASAWLDTLTPEEGRNALDHLQALTDEHRRRANQAEALAEQIRQRFSSVAQWNQAPSVLPSRG